MTNDILRALNEDIKNGDIDAYTWTQICDAAQDAEWLTDLGRNKRFKFVRNEQSADDILYINRGFLCDEDGYVQVYTDGACLRNGSDFPAAGMGVFFNYDHPS